MKSDKDQRDNRDATRLGEALLALRARAPKATLAKLYDKHEAKLTEASA